MQNNEKISLIVLALIVGFVVSNEMRLFKPTNYLECKNNKGTFYLKIIQNFHILSTLQTCLVLCFLAPFNFI